jgi:hypothetical protein
MRALSEIPLEILYYCPEGKKEEVFVFSGFVRFGYIYRCKEHAREIIIEDAQLDWIIAKGLVIK